MQCCLRLGSVVCGFSVFPAVSVILNWIKEIIYIILYCRGVLKLMLCNYCFVSPYVIFHSCCGLLISKNWNCLCVHLLVSGFYPLPSWFVRFVWQIILPALLTAWSQKTMVASSDGNVMWISLCWSSNKAFLLKLKYFDLLFESISSREHNRHTTLQNPYKDGESDSGIVLHMAM